MVVLKNTAHSARYLRGIFTDESNATKKLRVSQVDSI